MNKKNLIENLLNNIREDDEVKDIWVTRDGRKVNVGLINQFKLHDFIPNKQFDWKRRVDAPVVIVGQDWGPYKELKKFIKDYQVESKKKKLQL